MFAEQHKCNVFFVEASSHFLRVLNNLVHLYSVEGKIEKKIRKILCFKNTKLMAAYIYGFTVVKYINADPPS